VTTTRQHADAAGINSTTVETVHLVGVGAGDGSEAREHLEELERLVATLGFETRGTTLVKLRRATPRYLVGSGKAIEICDAARSEEADCIVFDDDLSPSQQRNWEKLTDGCVIDRHEIILDIFAAHATSRESVLQVALARAEYSLPRLTRAWTHLSRQRGGRQGTRGEGEMQLEVDRRIVLRKIARFKRELAELARQRALRRSRRESIPVPSAAIVGYTNDGKSSLLNALTGANVGVADELFKTLDATTRRLVIPNSLDLLLTDTVGFIRKLPYDLVDAFKSTLEEARLADFLIIVLDISDLACALHYQTTLSVLRDIGAETDNSIIVLNKCDLVGESESDDALRRYPEAILASSKRGIGLDELKSRLRARLYSSMSITRFVLPESRHDLAAMIHRTGRIVEEVYENGSIILTAQVSEQTQGRLRKYVT